MHQLCKILLLLTFTLSAPSLRAVDTDAPVPTEQHTRKISPKDLEPTFPPEDLIEKPSEQDNKFFKELLNTLASLGLLIGLILIAVWFLKRFASNRMEQANQTSLIKVLEKRALSPKSMLYLLEIEGTGYLIAESINGVTHLSEFPIIKEDQEPPLTKSFEKILDAPR